MLCTNIYTCILYCIYCNIYIYIYIIYIYISLTDKIRDIYDFTIKSLKSSVNIPFLRRFFALKADTRLCYQCLWKCDDVRSPEIAQILKKSSSVSSFLVMLEYLKHQKEDCSKLTENNSAMFWDLVFENHSLKLYAEVFFT